MMMHSLRCHKERQVSVQRVHGSTLFTVPQRETSKRAGCAWYCTLYSLRCHKERQASVQGVHGDALFTVSQRETSKRAVCAW